MKKLFFFSFIIMIFFKNFAQANYDKLIYDFQIDSIDGKKINFSSYKDKAILIVNVASYCGFTNQYNDLQKHYRAMLEEITQLKPAVDKFFDDVLVMAEDDALRKARLGMLSEVQGFLMHVADFTRIHTEG